MPVRRVSNRGGNIIGYFPSLKMKRMVEFESLIEQNFIYLLDFEKDIAAFTEQPCVIHYQYEGKALKYTPDFRLDFANGSTLIVECKPQQFVATDKNQIKFTAARRWCTELGYQFMVMTDEILDSNSRVRNVKLLTQHARHSISPITQRKITALLTSTPAPLTMADVMAVINPQNPTSAVTFILHMAFHLQLFIPLNDAPIYSGSPVSLFNDQKETYRNEHAAIFGWETISVAERYLRGSAATAG